MVTDKKTKYSEFKLKSFDFNKVIYNICKDIIILVKESINTI